MNNYLKIKSINSDLGLPSNQVHAIAQDSNKRIWLAGPAGLSRYDGNEICVFDNQNGLQCQGLRTVEIKDEIVWIGTDKGLETIHTNGTSTNIIIDPHWPYGLVEHIEIVGESVWLGSSFGLLRLQYNKNEKTASVAMSAKLGFVRDFVVMDDDSIIAAAGGRLIQSDGNSWHYLINNDIPVGGVILCLHRYTKNKILVGTENGMFIIDNYGKTLDHIIPSHSITKISAISNTGNEWWVGIGTDVLLYKENAHGVNYENTFPIGSSVNEIFVDEINNVWVCSNSSGIKKISCLRNVFSKIECGIAGAVYSIRKIKNQGLRIGGETFCSSILKPELPRHSQIEVLAGMPAMTIWDSCEDPNDETMIWLATQEGLFCVKEGKVEQFGKEDPVLKSPARCLLVRGKDLFVGTLSGLSRITGTIVEEIFGDENKNLGYVYSLELDEHSKMWIGTLGSGLWNETDNGLNQITGGPLSPTGNTYVAIPNQKGEVFIIQDERIIHLNEKGVARLVCNEFPVAGWCAAWMNGKNVIVGSNDGLLLIDLVENKISKRVNPLLGKGGWQFTNNKALFVESDERIYCGLNAGLFCLNLKGIASYEKPPDLFLNDIEWENGLPVPNGAAFKIKSGKWGLKVSVFCAWFIDVEMIRFRFQLIGFNENWSALQSASTIKYTSLPPGEYELKGQAYSALTGFGNPITLLKIQVLSPWWTIGLFRPYEWLTNTYDRVFKSGLKNKKLNEYNRTLEIEIAERTLELKKKGDELEANQTVLLNLVDDLKQKSEELILAKTLAEAADNLKSAFLATMSHELRTPLNSIIGFTGIILQELAGPLNPEQAKQLGMVRNSANLLLSLINDILDLSKIEAGQLIVEKESFNLNQSISKVASIVAPFAEKKGLLLHMQTESGLCEMVSDQRRVEQVLLNLLNNAIKFTEQGKVTLTTELISVNKEQNDSSPQPAVRIIVADTGIGIKPENLSLLFKPFIQIDSTLSRMHEGTGLGLVICQRLAELLGGEIKAKSEFGKGSKFTFTIPLQ